MSIKYLEVKALEEGKLSLAAFDEWLWEFIDETVMPEKFWNENDNFCQAVTFEAWKKYVNSNVNHVFIAELLKDMFVSLFNFNLLDNSDYEN